jgi:CheY-like chemotaxis protein/two-component sensor histidine kinase
MKMKPDDPQRPLIDHILASSDRAAHLTQSLLAFSRKQVIIPKPVDLNAIVKSVEKLLWRLIGEDIEFTTHLALQSLIVMADAGQIEQVLMNLATNARDAMPRGGELALSTEVRVIREDFTDAHGYGRPGSYAMITVSDTGTGMDEATRGKIFEPFFTTKEQGKGTGLGLSMVYGIIKQHDGNITVFSEPEKGTTFRILLPLIAMEVEEAHSEMDMPPPGGTETLLFAEDDLDVRSLTTTILRDFGYRVIVALDGRDALEKYNEYSDEIDLLILDVIMPKMSGKETYDAVRAIRPDSKFLFISGYTADALHKKGVFEEGAHFVAKPMSPFELLTKVRAVLDGTP